MSQLKKQKHICDDCPKCGAPMERGITEYGQICVICFHYEDDAHWAMEGEYLNAEDKPVENPRQSELED